jgi:AcrR family transcriptional regulator
MPTLRRSTKEEIVLAAERLIAAHGLAGTSLRQIGAAAGNGNNSAVIYHFGTKEQLVEAIFQYRVPRLHARRSFIIGERRPTDLRGWLDCQVRAVLEQSELDDSHYMGFVASLQLHDGAEGFKHLPDEFVDSRLDYEAHLRSHLGYLDEPLQSLRLSQAMFLIVQAAAARERSRGRGDPLLSFSLEVANLLDASVGMLRAPVSAATKGALEGTAAVALHRPMVP